MATLHLELRFAVGAAVYIYIERERSYLLESQGYGETGRARELFHPLAPGKAAGSPGFRLRNSQCFASPHEHRQQAAAH